MGQKRYPGELRHLRVGATAFFKKLSPPESDLVGICPVLKFDPDADEQVYLSESIPLRMAAGTIIVPVVDWCYEGTADNGKVVWGLEYKNITTGEAVAGGTTAVLGTSEPNQGSGLKIRTSLATGIIGAAKDDVLEARLFRDADDATNDTLLVDACFIQLHLHLLMPTR